MKSLTGQDVYNKLRELKNNNIRLENVVIYIGDDEELNGIHSAFFFNNISEMEDKEKQYYADMINENYGNIKYDEDKINILIS